MSQDAWRIGKVGEGEQQSQAEESHLGEEEEPEECAAAASSTQESPPVSECVDDKIAQQQEESLTVSECGGDKIAHQQEGAIPTPDKVEEGGTRWRPMKRSTKGLTRFKVDKDKRTTPVQVKTKRKCKENGRQPVGGDKSVRRKFDFEGDRDFEGGGEFSRAKLMEDLRCHAKVHGLCNDPGAGKGSKIRKKRKKMTGQHQDSGELAIVPYQKAPTAASSSALVPTQNSAQPAIVHCRNHLKNLRTKVLGLDENTLQVASLPPAEEHWHEHGKEQASIRTPGSLFLSNVSHIPGFQQVCQPQVEINSPAGRESIYNCEPIIVIPPSPDHEYEESPNEQELYEDDLCDIEDIISKVQYAVEIDLCSVKHMGNNGSWTPNSGKDLALVNPQQASVQNKKLKNIGRLRTKHHAYVLPDDHAILEEFEERVPEDPCPYLLVVISCSDEHTVKGTILIPCGTATRGNFPLHGTYFQEHEVFADNSSSNFPIPISRECIWNLDRCIVYFGLSIHSITKGQTRQRH